MKGLKRQTALTFVLFEVGDYLSSGSDYPVSDRGDGAPYNAYASCSGRPALYIK